MQQQNQEYRLTTLQAAPGDMQHEPILCVDFKTVILSLHATGGAGYTVKVEASNESPNALPTVFSFMQVINLDSGNAIPGTTGISILANGEYKYEINNDRMVWMKITISSYTSGELTADVLLTNNA